MLQILDTISDPGSAHKPNEDAFGHGRSHAWVIDGATGVADSELLDGPSDAHWLARTAGALFAEQAELYGGDLAGLTRAAIEEMACRFAAGRSRAPNGRYELPSAAMMMVHSDGANIHCANFADCRLALLADDGETVILGDHHQDREAASKARTASLLSKIAEGDDPFASPDIMRFLRRARDYQNREDGYWILGLDPCAVDFMRSWTLPLTKPVTGLLMSDGFAAIAYDYERIKPADLVARTLDEGLAAIVQAIRGVEREDDPRMRRYPRFKCCDDATAVLFRAVPATL
ncbi:MAG: protein phosphatase 2C domain-containing protein [Parvibaculum sp.]|uniref:protein phosphatase 2C domain-containing protein n=1 Tax=Parvibaculum sp. TaxID=2024848 RepID=UPI0025EACC5C|nr:protein phosphatase 2C domain-containing protein [Parvibaculum sp.]MCE9649299.1 protein phosphatase 2C domain-containing protein [Parvibaculum sp.]